MRLPASVIVTLTGPSHASGSHSVPFSVERDVLSRSASGPRAGSDDLKSVVAASHIGHSRIRVLRGVNVIDLDRALLPHWASEVCAYKRTGSYEDSALRTD